MNEIISEQILRIKEIMGLLTEDILSNDEMLDGQEESVVDDEIIPVVGYKKYDHKPQYHYVYFSGLDFSNLKNGQLPLEGEIKLVDKNNVESDIILDVKKFKPQKWGSYGVWDSDVSVMDLTNYNKDSEKTIDKSQIDAKFKKVVFDSIKDIYGNNPETWSTEGNRGPRGQGGVVNIHTINDFLNGKGESDIESEGGEWSIINYFDTNPKVREYLMKLFNKETGKTNNTEEGLTEWIKWIFVNRERLFKEGEVLDNLVKLNFTSFYNGIQNEKKAYEYVLELFQNKDKYEMGKINLPGSSLDRAGVDFSVIDKSNNKVYRFQAKPLASVIEEDGKYIVTSYNVYGLDKKPVEYFIFTSHSGKDVVIFKNNVGQYVVKNNNTVEFNYPPMKSTK
jgi:hypothetical protein